MAGAVGLGQKRPNSWGSCVGFVGLVERCRWDPWDERWDGAFVGIRGTGAHVAPSLATMDPYEPTPVEPDELPALAGDVRYEFDAFRSAAGLLLKLGPNPSPARNPFVESLNLHFRNLREFFVSPLPKPTGSHCDDIVAAHYVPTWHPDDDVDLELRAFDLKPLHKRLAHLTAYRQRVDKDDDSVLVIDMYLMVAETFARFLSRLTTEQREWFALDGMLPDTGLPISSQG